jgi:hypothetical protein
MEDPLGVLSVFSAAATTEVEDVDGEPPGGVVNISSNEPPGGAVSISGSGHQ